MPSCEQTGLHCAAPEDLESRLRKIEEALNEQKEFSESLIRYSAVATFVIDAGHRVIYWNRACEELTGIGAAEIVGTDSHWKPFYAGKRPCLADIVIDKRPEVLPQYYATFGKSPLILEGLHAEGWYQGLGGKDRYIIFEAAPIFSTRGEMVAAIETLQDITFQKLTEAELLKTQKLESIGVLAGGIAHDFNNLLTAITGNISLAIVNANSPEIVRDRLAEAEKVSVRARDLTNQLLTFSKGGDPILKTVAISRLLIDSANLMLSGSNVKCEFSIPDALYPVEVDEGQISRVIHNIIINAHQAMPEGGVITVTAENMTVPHESDLPLPGGKYVKITVRDRGIGIPKAIIPKIFDPYFTTKQKGSGFGLAVAYSIIKKHNGTITVESEVGAGSTFYIHIPASEKDASADNKAWGRQWPGSGRILVMDDEEVVRDVAGEMLSHLGYKAEFAKDGTEALDLYEKALESGQGFDAVIMDLTIPGGMGGKEAMKRLLAIDSCVKAIVSSGYSNDPVMSDFRKHGFGGVLSKPYEIGEMGEVLYGVITAKNKFTGGGTS